MSCEPVVRLGRLGKCYHIYARPRDRLLQMLVRGRRRLFKEFWALKDVTLEIMPGEVIGIIGSNGAGKSTLLQLVCGTIAPTTGLLRVGGRIAALLELGTGFNPQFSGRENVFLSASIAGMSHAEISSRFDDIVEFSGVRDFIDQPVKTYSSGMYVRLAFSVAIHTDPDILVIDEALSVGDGAFARKSFGRIMALKDAGKTILFCSHALYQIEALCDRAIWLDRGVMKKMGDPGEVIIAYNAFLDAGAKKNELLPVETHPIESANQAPAADDTKGNNRLTGVDVSFNERKPSRRIGVVSGKDTVFVKVAFASDPLQPAPHVGVVIADGNEKSITSAGTHIDQVAVCRDRKGRGVATLIFPKLPLLKGEYAVYVFLLCEKGIQVFDYVHSVARISIRQTHLEQGIVSIPHSWDCHP